MMGIIAAAVHLTGYVIYNRQINRGDSVPNLTSWGIFALLAVIGAVSYYNINIEAWYESGPPIVGACASTFTFIHAIGGGRFQRPTIREGFILVICLLSIVVYVVLQSAAYSNFIVIIAFLVAFWPMFNAVRRNPVLEKPIPWIVWTCGYTLFLIVVLLGSHWERLFLPITLGSINASMIWLSSESRRKKVMCKKYDNII